jgi:hypothetical protein
MLSIFLASSVHSYGSSNLVGVFWSQPRARFICLFCARFSAHPRSTVPWPRHSSLDSVVCARKCKETQLLFVIEAVPSRTGQESRRHRKPPGLVLTLCFSSWKPFVRPLEVPTKRTSRSEFCCVQAETFLSHLHNFFWSVLNAHIRSKNNHHGFELKTKYVFAMCVYNGHVARPFQ